MRASPGVTTSFTPPEVNAAPSFSLPDNADQTIAEDVTPAAQSVANFIDPDTFNDGNESTQQFDKFIVTADHPDLFSVPPAINVTTGALTYTPKANTAGTATISVSLKDKGGTANGGVDTSEVSTFDIEITAVNDVPSFTKGVNVTVDETSNLTKVNTITGWAKNISRGGGADEASQTLTFIVVSNSNESLFTEAGQPAVAADGTLTFTTIKDTPGTASITIKLMDDGGTDPGVDTSATQDFQIIVKALANKLPTITAIDDVETDEDTPTDALTFSVSDRETTDPTKLITSVLSIEDPITGAASAAVLPAGVKIVGTGANRTVQVTPVKDKFGEAVITIQVKDGGGAVALETFTVSVNSINDAPTFTAIKPVTTKEDTAVKFVLTAGTSFKDADLDDVATDLIVGGSSNNDHVLVSVTPSADGKTQTVTVTPSNNFFTPPNTFVVITLTADDGEAVGSTMFNLTVTPVNDAPTLVISEEELPADQDEGEPDAFVSEGAATGDEVLTVDFSDVEAGSHASAFAIETVNGVKGSTIFSLTRVGTTDSAVLKVATASLLDFEKTRFYDVVLTTTDNAVGTGDNAKKTGTAKFRIGVEDIETGVFVGLFYIAKPAFEGAVTVEVGSAANRLVVNQRTGGTAAKPTFTKLTGEFSNVQYNDIVFIDIIGTEGADNIKLLGSLNTTGINALGLDLSSEGSIGEFEVVVYVEGLGGADNIDARLATKFNVHLDGRDGNDKLYGGAKDDVLCGDEGKDLLFGGAGNDALIGGGPEDDDEDGNANDTIRGGSGNDTLLGMGGDDDLDGGAGDDVILGGSGADKILGGTGADKVLGEAGEDNIQGGAGNDTLDGGDDIDNINGGVGDDSLNGGGGVDVVSDPDVTDVDEDDVDALFEFAIDEILALCDEVVEI